MDTAFNIRPAASGDKIHIQTLLRTASIHAGGLHPAVHRRRRSAMRRALSILLRPLYSSHIDHRVFHVVESSGGEIVGCGKILPRGKGIWEIASLAIQKDWRGTGVALAGGRYLLERAPRPLWGICPPRYVPFYKKFGADEVSESKRIPIFLRRRLRLIRAVLKIARRRQELVVMVIEK